jgi:hypothetical protein
MVRVDSSAISSSFPLDLDVLALVEFVALEDVLVHHLVAAVHIDLEVLDAVAALPVELVEGDLLGVGAAG